MNTHNNMQPRITSTRNAHPRINAGLPSWLAPGSDEDDSESKMHKSAHAGTLVQWRSIIPRPPKAHPSPEPSLLSHVKRMLGLMFGEDEISHVCCLALAGSCLVLCFHLTAARSHLLPLAPACFRSSPMPLTRSSAAAVNSLKTGFIVTIELLVKGA